MFDESNPQIKFAAQAVREVMPLAEKIRFELAGKQITKGDRSPVTVADFSIQAIIRHRLSQAFPDDCFLGEESSEMLLSEEGRGNLKLVTHYVQSVIPEATENKVCQWIDGKKVRDFKNRFWTLDPIDGTKGFLRGAQYAIALALIEKGKVSLGILGCPHLNPQGNSEISGSGALMMGICGQGAWSTERAKNSGWNRIQVSAQRDGKHAVILGSVDPTHTDTDQLKNLMSFLKNQTRPNLMDSQAKYAALACGRGDFFLYFLPPGKSHYRMKIWDVAPGAIVVEEAGGKVTDLLGKPLDFSCGQELAKNPGLLISNGSLHEELLAGILKPTF